MKQKQKNLVCIQCGDRIESIFKIYSDGFKDIIECEKCKKLVDEYVECEYSVILIDLILFKTKTYRHILINQDFKISILVKFLVTFLLCDAYLNWFHMKNRQYESIRSNDHQLFYELEWNFYFMLIRALLNFLIYASIIVLLSCFNMLLTDKRRNLSEFIHQVFKSLILSSFGKLIVLPLVIWNPNDIYFNLALLFTYLSNSQAISVVTKMKKFKCKALVLLSVCLVHLFDKFLQPILLDISE